MLIQVEWSVTLDGPISETRPHHMYFPLGSENFADLSMQP